MKKKVILIAGGSASGKSSIAKKIYNELINEHSIVIIRQDDYYKDQSNISFENRIKTNYDHPFAFDNDLLLEHLKILLSGNSIEKPIYDFKNHTRSKDTETINDVDIILLEGLFVLYNQEIREFADIKIFVETDSDIRFIRRLVRDVKDRGRSIDSVISQYLNSVKPMHEQFVENSKKYADIIVPEGSKNEVAINLLINHIKN